ncbi:MAG: hypothetical protein Q7L55_02945 [Actinomycetota bacterium]|nr:hypothetical protein [Actinomycetota bacterium]
MLLDVAGIARSTFFYHQAKAGQPDPRAELKAAITGVPGIQPQVWLSARARSVDA